MSEIEFFKKNLGPILSNPPLGTMKILLCLFLPFKWEAHRKELR